MELTADELRVLASLVEKDRTTPDSYPLTTNALQAACNQKTSRDPVTALSAAEVDAAMLSLREQGLARTVRGDGHRSFKHRHIIQEVIDVDDQELAVLAVLMLRGPQTSGELRTRTERYVGFESVDAVEATLARLAHRSEPLVVDLGRAPGQSQDRWFHLLGTDDAPSPAGASEGAAPVAAPQGEPSPPPGIDRIAALEAQVAALQGTVDMLCDQLGIEAPER